MRKISPFSLFCFPKILLNPDPPDLFHLGPGQKLALLVEAFIIGQALKTTRGQALEPAKSSIYPLVRSSIMGKLSVFTIGK